MDAREDGVYVTYTPTIGADTVTKKLGSGKIMCSAFYAAGSGNNDGRLHFILDGHKKFTIGSINFKNSDKHLKIYKDSVLLADYNTNRSLLSFNIDGASTLRLEFAGWSGDTVCSVNVTNIVIE